MKESRMDPNAVKRVVVVGAGTMGNGIAQVFARAGIEVGLVDVDQKALDRAMDRIESGLRTLVEYGSVSENEMAPIGKAAATRGCSFGKPILPRHVSGAHLAAIWVFGAIHARIELRWLKRPKA